MISSRVIAFLAFAAHARAEDSVDGVVDSLVNKMSGRWSDLAPKAGLDGTTLGKAAATGGVPVKAALRSPRLSPSHTLRSPVLAATGKASNSEQTPANPAADASALTGRRAAMQGVLASMATMPAMLAGMTALRGAATSPAEAKRERAYDLLRRSGLQYETLALNLDKEAREVAEKQPDLAQAIGASQAVASVGAIATGFRAHRNGVLLEAQKKKVEDRLKVEEKLLSRLQQVHQKLNDERRAARAREMKASKQSAGTRDEAYEAIRQILKRGKDALSRQAAQEAQALFEQALMAAQQAGPSESDLARKALRGLAAAAQLAGDVRKAITYIKGCLELSSTRSEQADSLGFMGDLYEAIGDYDNAAKYYDQWLQTVGGTDNDNYQAAKA